MIGSRALFLAARPKTLTAAVAPVVVGTALAAYADYEITWWVSLSALLGAVAIQVGTNLFNDLLDFQKGADREDRLGPTRVTQSGALTARQVRSAAATSFVIAAGFGVPLIVVGGWPILTLGLLSLVFGYAYTGGPVPLAYHGLGEVFVLLFFGLGAVGGTFYLQAGRLDYTALVAGTQMGLLACGLLAVNNLRDIVSDERSHKRTLAVRLGVTFGRVEIAACGLLPFALGWLWVDQGAIRAAWLPLLVLPLAIATVGTVYRHEPGVVYNRALAAAAGLQLGFGLLLSIGLAL